MCKACIIFILGLWLIISGFITPLQNSVNMFMIGILVIIFSPWDVYGNLNGTLGIWLFLSGSIIDLATSPNYLIIGIVISLLSLWSIFQQIQDQITHKTENILHYSKL